MNKLIFEYPWISKVFSMSKEYGLDWIRMTALALALSKGDPRLRVIDWDFIDLKLGPDNPGFARLWEPKMSIDIIDRGTKWGLYQIHGQVAIDKGVFQGRLINFTDNGANTRAACILLSTIVNKHNDIRAAEKYVFGIDPSIVDGIADDLRASITVLINIDQTNG